MKHLIVAFFVMSLLASCGGEKTRKVEIQTEFGNMKVELFNSTPQHRDNFVKLIEEGFYDDLLFHRVMSNFMIQGGDPNSKDAPAGGRLGTGGPGYKIPAEIGEYHFKGRLAAARQPDASNPERQSSGSQFYIIHGRNTTAADVRSYGASKGIPYTEEDIKVYEQSGGYHFLDGEYSVFGQVTEGLDVIDKIAVAKKDPANRPFEDIKMKVVIID